MAFRTLILAGLILVGISHASLAKGETVALFNGKDLSGWEHEGPRATFSAENGTLVTSGAGHQPNWLHTAREYENFRLRFEYRLDKWAEAAVILRAPRLGRPIQAGVAIQLAHDFHHVVDDRVTGAVAGALPPKAAFPESFEVWHAVDLTLDGDRLRVSIDGTVAQDIDLSANGELSHRLKRGYIGFPDLGYRYAVRGITIEDFGNRLAFTDLNPSSLADWELRGGGSWSVRDGVITGANGHGILYSPASFSNFELTVLVRSHNHVNSGVFLRGSADGKKPRGFEVQIDSPPDRVYPTGSIYGIQRSRSAGDFEERWFLLQVRVEGRRCLVRLDGETVAETDRLPEELKSGQIGLQIHMENASVEFRDLRVRELAR